MESIVTALYKNRNISDEEIKILLENNCQNVIAKYSQAVARENYGNKIFLRGLIEISNYCKNNCYYCGIRSGNRNICRYRLTLEEILSCCDLGYSLGLRTFVLQGGEDNHFSDDDVCRVVYSIKEKYPDCAVTLSIGEKEYESYKAYFNSGADRYLLRHETANEGHYNKLHPDSMSLKNRKHCLYNLKEIGYQVGCGIMVGSPNQTTENIIEDIRFMQELSPDMIGIGPFIPHKDTPFRNEKQGSVDLTLKLISILRLMFPNVLLPATTALGTLQENGREQAILRGANVIMPNISPKTAKENYTLYNNKLNTGLESAEGIELLKKSLRDIGYEAVTDRGDRKGFVGQIKSK